MRNRGGLPNIPQEVNSIFMQRLTSLVKNLCGLGRDKGKQAVTREDLVKLGIVTKEEIEKL